jgi:nucleotide-binding universal stress UspA family protein
MSFKHLLVAIDFGEPSEHALETAIELAKSLGAALTVLHCYEIPSYAYGGMSFVAADLLGPIHDAAREQMGRVMSAVQKRVPGARGVLRRGVPWTEILVAIEETKPDLVVTGTHGRRGVSHALLGSVAEKIVRTSPVPVLTVRPRQESARG